MSYYKRRGLPHWDPGDAALFLTWRLFGSVAAAPPEWERLPEGERFAAEDEALEKRATGPRYLQDPAIAEAVSKAIFYGADRLHLYDLEAWVIMSNHVHVLISPRSELSRITRSIKGFSAREANVVLGRTGEPFWAIETFDRWVRDRKEFAKIVRYIEFNPVKAGLVERPEDYRWSSAWAGQEACVT